MKTRKKYIKPNAKKQLKALAAVRGLERVEYFTNNGTAVGWNGGTSVVFKNNRADENRNRCRKKIIVEDAD